MGQVNRSHLISLCYWYFKYSVWLQAGSHWVGVHNLKTISGGGILDPDDQLHDVCDDREQVSDIINNRNVGL